MIEDQKERKEESQARKRPRKTGPANGGTNGGGFDGLAQNGVRALRRRLLCQLAMPSLALPAHVARCARCRERSSSW